MKIRPSDLKIGDCILVNDKICEVISLRRVKPGKGHAYIQLELKAITTGEKINKKFESSETIRCPNVFLKKFQYLYNKYDIYLFLDQETFEEIELSKEFVGLTKYCLIEQLVVDIQFFEEKPLRIILPTKVKLQVIKTEPVLKGKSSVDGYKTAALSTGLSIKVPAHIENEEYILVNTKDFSYVEKSNV